MSMIQSSYGAPRRAWWDVHSYRGLVKKPTSESAQHLRQERLRLAEGAGSIEAHAIAKGRTRPQLHHRARSGAVKHSILRCRYGL